MQLRLYSYYRSSAAFRVRIALALKDLACEIVPVDLSRGEQASEAFRAVNPQGFVPALQLPDGRVLGQSLAIVEWLESAHPLPALLPEDPFERARVRAFCATIACDIHPLNNLRVLRHLEHGLGLDAAARERWYHRWLDEGFAALEPRAAGREFVGGDAPGMAEAFLVPQVYNAHRFRYDMGRWPALQALYERCLPLPAFLRAHPDSQPDRA